MKPAFVIVDDDDDARESALSLCKNAFPGCAFRDYESLAQVEQTGRVDLLLVDTSAMSHGHWSFMSSGLAKFVDRHPSAEVFIMSGMSYNALRDLLEELEEDYGINCKRIHIAGFEWNSIRDTIKNKSTALSGPVKAGMIE